MKKSILGIVLCLVNLTGCATANQTSEPASGIRLSELSGESDKVQLLNAVVENTSVFEYQLSETTEYAIWCDSYEKGIFVESQQVLYGDAEKSGSFIFSSQVTDLADETDTKSYQFNVDGTNLNGSQSNISPIEAMGLMQKSAKPIQVDKDGSYPLLAINFQSAEGAKITSEMTAEQEYSLTDEMLKNGKEAVNEKNVPYKLLVFRVVFH